MLESFNLCLTLVWLSCMLEFVVVFQFGLVELDVGVCRICVSVWFGSVVVESL